MNHGRTRTPDRRWREKPLYLDHKGFSLVEVLISMALIAVLASSLLGGLSVLPRTQGKHQELAGALVGARTEVELVKMAPYDTSVTSTPGPAYSSLPTSQTVGGIPFDIAISARLIEVSDVQLVTVVVSTSGVEVVRLQTYKVNR